MMVIRIDYRSTSGQIRQDRNGTILEPKPPALCVVSGWSQRGVTDDLSHLRRLFGRHAFRVAPDALHRLSVIHVADHLATLTNQGCGARGRRTRSAAGGAPS